MICITGYGVIAEKPHVSQLGGIFCAPCRKNYVLAPYFDSLDVFYHCAKFGEDRTNRAGYRCKNMVCVRFFVKLSRTGRSLEWDIL